MLSHTGIGKYIHQSKHKETEKEKMQIGPVREKYEFMGLPG